MFSLTFNSVWYSELPLSTSGSSYISWPSKQWRSKVGLLVKKHLKEKLLIIEKKKKRPVLGQANDEFRAVNIIPII